MFVSKCKCQRERTGSFSPFRSCVSSAFGSFIGTISPLESKLAVFQCKEDKKNLRAKVKLTVPFKNKASNLETQKHTKRIEIHQSQITNDYLLFPKKFAKMYKRPYSETQGQIVGVRESLNGRKNMAQKKSKERPEEPLGTRSYQTSSKRSPPFWLLIGARKLVFFWPQSEARTAATV